MIDQFALALPHFLLGLACWRLLMRDTLDRDPPAPQSASGETSGA
jgi:hypothetical protein